MKYLIFIIALIFTLNIANAEDYFYDDAGRLIEVAYDNGYYVTYKYDNNGNIISQTVSMESSVKEDRNKAIDLKTFPNPVKSEFTVSFKLDKASVVTLNLYDASGRLVNKVNAGNLNEGEHQLEMNTADASGKFLSDGSYILSLEINNKDESYNVDHEIIIQK